jgi:large subunit ribosomal protein L32
MTVRMRATRSHTGNRRSHHAIKVTSIGICSECKKPKMKHRACVNCGKYDGKSIINVHSKIEKKAKKAKKNSK